MYLCSVGVYYGAYHMRGKNYLTLIGWDGGHFFLITRHLGHDYLMLIGYKMLGNEALLPMKFFLLHGFPFR